jgi:phage protein D/phage baseplate assembly protein gpV
MPDEQKLMDHLYIKIGGNDLPTEAMDDLIEVVVDSSLHLPDMFTINLHDEQVKWVEDDLFGLGKEVEISAIPEEGGRSQPLFKGEITATEPEFGEGTQANFLIRGYDRSHRLHRGSHSKAYQQVTISDLVDKIGKEVGLRTQVEATTEVYDHVQQHNQTHMEFLTQHAQRIGYEICVEDKTLCFRKPSKNGSKIALEWGVQLRSFRPRLTLAEQVDEVIVRGWDPKNRQAIVGQATRGEAEPETGHRQSGAAMASSAFQSAKRVVVDRNVQSQAEADTLAQAICDELSGALSEAEGECFGQPDLLAGVQVELSALGSRFNGTYFVTGATHIYRADGAYLTRFTVHGRRPQTLQALLQTVTPGSTEHLVPGPVVGVVTNNKDPEDRARVKVKYPWLSEEVESDWARVVSPGAGNGRGLMLLPEVNDEVLIAFEHGRVARPYVIGGLWNGKDKAPLSTSDALEGGNVRQRAFKSRAGHALILTDGSDEGVVLQTAAGHIVTLSDEKKSVTVETPGGHKLVLDDSKSEITVESTANMTIKTGANLTLEAQSLPSRGSVSHSKPPPPERSRQEQCLT